MQKSQLIRDDRPAPRSLHVSGRKEFTEDKWRDCILHYLNGLWSDDLDVTWRPRLHLGEITLRLDEEKGEYFAYGKPIEFDTPIGIADHETLTVGRGQLEVQDGLARFVKNDRIKLLNIDLSNDDVSKDAMEGFSALYLWKKPWRSRFGISALGIPSQLEA